MAAMCASQGKSQVLQVATTFENKAVDFAIKICGVLERKLQELRPATCAPKSHHCQRKGSEGFNRNIKLDCKDWEVSHTR